MTMCKAKAMFTEVVYDNLGGYKVVLKYCKIRKISVIEIRKILMIVNMSKQRL